MTPYTTHSLHKPPLTPNPAYAYALYAVIEHHGTLTSGHYTCFVRMSGKEPRWFRFNDHVVSQVSWETVAACQAYMCFYLKRTFEYA
jgi:ubiquitin carboxyl-terminal hydrolase 22/27/51